MRMILIGPQGSGKGTQADRLASRLGASHIASGDLVRQEIEDGTTLGKQIAGYNDRGELVPDDVVVAMVLPHLSACPSWILDGFPRDVAQARILDASLQQLGIPLDRVVQLAVPDAELVTRLAGRRVSEATGKTYHIVYDPPPKTDPGPFVQRADDTPESIHRRLELYHLATEPLLQFYQERGLLVRVDASGTIDAVTASILPAL